MRLGEPYNDMEGIISVVVISFVVGAVHTFIKPYLDSAVPATWKANFVTQSLFTGAFIVIALVISTTALRAIGLSKKKGVV